MSTPAPTVGPRRATSVACPARAPGAGVAEPVVDLAARAAMRAAEVRRHPASGAYAEPERVAMTTLIGERIFEASTIDGATASPLLHEEAMNLAGAVVELIEECRGLVR